MKVWAILRGIRNLVLGALVALLVWLALTNSPLWPRPVAASQHDGHGPTEKQPKPADARAEQLKEKEEEKKSALDHVLDSPEWEISDWLGWHVHLPKVFGFQITKFMVLEIIAALLVAVIYIPLAQSIRTGHVPRGAFANLFEVFLTFIRDQVAKPGVGEHDADRHVPFLWTMFLFILFNNLLGMVPLGGSATGSIFVTLGLALMVFLYMHGNAIAKMGFGNYVSSLWPHIDVPFPMGYFIKPLIFVIEWIGVIVRNLVLAVRLFANMFAGHMVLATFLIFIWMARNAGALLWGAVTVSSVLGIVALSLLELFVAFLQAYIFTFLTALFLGMALHPEH